jgi:uncharacterized protein YfaS (alpha-2-macroglobulin family)/tetratricopeptide (TPR) repeat protein
MFGGQTIGRLAIEVGMLLLLSWTAPAWAAEPQPPAATPASAAATQEDTGIQPAAAQPPTPLAQAKVAMQGKAWDQALPLLEAHLNANAPDADEARYLKALVQYYRGQHDAAIAAADVVLKQYKGSIWRQKALFLTAQAMVQQKNYRGAEEIYEAEALRLLGAARKHDVAGVLVKFADAMATKGDPHDVGALPPNYARAGNLYRKALGMEIGRDLKDEVMFKLGRVGQSAGQHPPAIQDYQAYLKEFDPDWTGPVGSQERALNQKRQNPPPAGQRILAARYRLAEAMLAAGQAPQARQELEDLEKMLGGPAKEGPGPKASHTPERVAPGDVAWLLVQTYRMPAPAAQELDKAVQATASFLARFSRHPHAVSAAYGIAAAYRSHGRLDQAVAAFEEFIAAKNFALPEGDLANKRLEGVNKTPAGLKEDLTRQAVFQIGQIRFDQRQYDKAIQQWQSYITRYPNGPQWADSQKGIVNAEFQVAVDAVAAAALGAGLPTPPERMRPAGEPVARSGDRATARFDQARELLAGFLTRHPLDDRVPQALFIFGQIHYAAAQKLEQDKAEAAAAQKAYRAAIEEWTKLVSRFPDREESSLAQYRIGLIHEEKLAELEPAIDAYRKLTWGAHAQPAAGRVAVMTQKALNLRTERVFRTTEPVQLKLSTRNIDKLTVKLYWLDLESYFRKTHGVATVEALDIALIQPDKTWEFKVAGYAKYKPVEQELAVPFEQNKPGACIVNVSEEDLEATTLAIRSDIDLILKSSRRETLVFVQDMVKRQPVADAELLLSDGQKIVATGKTGKDGVLRAKVDRLKETNDLRAMAKLGGHVAANAVSLSGLEFSTGLAPKGYLYTDRPAYRPGQTVQVRGIIRHVKDGAYVAPESEPYVVSVTDAQGRLIWEATRKLSAFGTLDATVELSDAAALGTYTVTARRDGQTALTFSGQFLVKQYHLERMRLKLQTDRTVYFRGETVQLEMTAEYYWGQPVVGKSVRYRLPDGASFAQPTDAQGRLKVTFDTTPLTPGRALRFDAEIEGENVKATVAAQLAVLGYGIGIRTSEPVVLAGQPFDVTLKTTGPDGKPVAAELNLTVLRRHVVKPDPVLSGVPWVKLPEQAAGEVTVLERPAKTDATTGQAVVALTLEQGGVYVLRAAGKDRFGQVVTNSGEVTISDAEDQVKLRFFADTATLKVGDKAAFRLHSRLDGPLALLTFEGEEIIDYRLLGLKKDFNPIELSVGHEHFPNFTVAAAAVDGRELRTASKSFTVQRELKVTLKSEKDTYAPGQAAKVALLVTDQLGRPVKAELSLALVDEALLSLFPDVTPNILEFFQADARRHAEFRVGSSCGFAYAGTTRQVPKAFIEETERLARQVTEEKRRAEAMSELQGQIADAPQLGGLARRAPAAEATSGRARGLGAGTAFGGTGRVSGPAPTPRGGKDGGKAPDGKPAEPDLAPVTGEEATRPAEPPRQELPEAGFWAPAVVTDEKGQATVTMPLPQSTTQWRLVSRGCTVETLVGQGTANLVTRKEFFVQLKSPGAIQEGDKIQVLGRVHNLGQFAGDAKVSLRLLGPDQQQLAIFSKTLAVRPQSVTELLFDAVEVPAVPRVRLEVSATTLPRPPGEGRGEGLLADAVVRALPVHPWGLEYAGHAGGTATSDAQVVVELPPDLEYKSRWLSVSVSPAIQRRVIEMALGPTLMPWVSGKGEMLLPPPRWAAMPGADLLAVASAVEYAKAVQVPEADYRRLLDRARTLAAAVVSRQQQDGGWGWTGVKGSDWGASAISFWALAAAKSQGVAVHEESFNKAKTYLAGMMAKLPANDNDAKAVVLHALSAAQAADFANVNRLYRERNELSPPALAYTALALANLGRPEIAKEVLAVLESKAKPHAADGRSLARWDGSATPWLSDGIETTAVALLALVRVTPESPKAAAAAQYLLSRHGCYGFHSAKAQGPAVAALAAWFGKAKFAANQYRLEVLVNNKPLQTIEVQGDQPTVLLAVPAELLVAGRNRVDFRMNGRGEYAYAATLRGFSATLKDFGSPPQYYHRRRLYQHADLEYRGRPLGASSTSPVRNLEIGQRVKVELAMHTAGQVGDVNTYRVLEEYLPAGTVLVEGSLTGDFSHYETTPTSIRMYFPPGKHIYTTHYQLVGYSTGTYRILPAVVRDATRPSWMVIGPASELTVLPPGQASSDPYVWNVTERFALGKALFDDGLYAEALQSLTAAHQMDKTYNEREVARMLLWIHTTKGFYDARQIVRMFEVLRERHPDLVIPFDRILVVGRAYRDIGEFERAWFVFRATIDASYINDSNVSAVLQDEGQFLASIDFQEDLWREYPDTPEVVSSYFALSQLLYDRAPKAHEIAKTERQLALRRGVTTAPSGRVPNKIDMLRQTIRMLRSFLTLYPDSPLADDAAFSMANALMELKSYPHVVSLSQIAFERYPRSEFRSSFQYMAALGHFWQRDYERALAAARVVADGDSKDRDFARYILAQIHHAQGKPADAIAWYHKVETLYPDAKEAIGYFEEKRISLEEVNLFKPAEPVQLKIKYRNIKDAAMQVYKVDLMKLYLREKNLSGMTKVQLSGIKPEAELQLHLGDGKDYVDKETIAKLPLKDEAAYLVICRGDDLFTSAVVLITPLKIEVQEDAVSGRLRANVIDSVKNSYVPEVHVKAIGSGDTAFKSGQTDLRGIFIADGLRGMATVIARVGESRYAFYRGQTWIGAPPAQPAPRAEAKAAAPAEYLRNVQEFNMDIQRSNTRVFEKFRRQSAVGVEVQQAK